MDLQVLANIGEFLGGLAILVSFVILIFNVRQNTSQLRENQRSIERTEQRATYEQHDRYRVAMLNPEVADLWTKALAGERLSDPDWVRFSQLAIMFTYSCQNNWDAGQRGVMASEEWQRIAPMVAPFYQTPGGSKFWNQYGHVFQPGFVAEVESLVRSNADAGVST
jgi:hypothetical protein